jgi:hypothetical protein
VTETAALSREAQASLTSEWGLADFTCGTQPLSWSSSLNVPCDHGATLYITGQPAALLKFILPSVNSPFNYTRPPVCPGWWPNSGTVSQVVSYECLTSHLSFDQICWSESWNRKCLVGVPHGAAENSQFGVLSGLG